MEKRVSAQSFQEALSTLYPELGGGLPDPEKHAEAIIVRGLNADTAEIKALLIKFYSEERVKAVARNRADRLDTPVYKALRDAYGLPERGAIVERMHSLWKP